MRKKAVWVRIVGLEGYGDAEFFQCGSRKFRAFIRKHDGVYGEGTTFQAAWDRCNNEYFERVLRPNSHKPSSR